MQPGKKGTLHKSVNESKPIFLMNGLKRFESLWWPQYNKTHPWDTSHYGEWEGGQLETEIYCTQRTKERNEIRMRVHGQREIQKES